MKCTFDHLAITVSNMEESIKFYKDAFNFEVIVERKFDDYGLITVFMAIEAVGTQLQLSVYGDPQPIMVEFGHFSIRTDNIEELRNNHIHKGFVVDSLVDAPHQKCYFIKDPNGYSIEVIQPK